MNCTACGANNREEAAFCRHCGRLLHEECPRCGSAAGPAANFCDACGCPLSPRAWTGGAPLRVSRSPELPDATASGSPIAASPTRPDSPAPPAAGSRSLDRFIPPELLDRLSAGRGAAAERRVVTMLFCDLQGSTQLAEQFDPEEWTEIVNGAFEQMVRPIYKYEGTVARLMGDGLLAFFGAPIAHEDDPRRAVLAGLAIIEGIRDWRNGLPPAARQLQARVGINTGLVVVGAVGSDLRVEYSAIGDAINLAARMEQTADPGTVRISEDTYRLVDGQFEVEPLGGIALKGKSEPVPAYRVLRRTTGATRRPVAGLHARLIDRRTEWKTLEDAFDGLNAGRGGIVFLTGDAGLGKTRLIDEAVERLLPMLNPSGRFVDAAAVSYESAQPYAMLLRLLRPALGLMPGDPPERVRERIEAQVESAEDARILASLFAAVSSDNGRDGGEVLAPSLDACLQRFWQAQAARGPLVLVLDELQWLDASSVDRLASMFHLAESHGVLFLCALRRERRSPGWQLKETAGRDLPHRLAEIALYPLNDGDSRALLADLLETAELPDTLARLILDKAEGNPLFLEEVVRHLIDRGDLIRGDAGDWITQSTGVEVSLPDSIQALLNARIDRLDEDTRRTLQVASVIGRQFMRSPLAALVDKPQRLDQQLLDLQRMELIREVSRVPEPGYRFDHTLTQEVVYHNILQKERRAMHLRVAETIETLREGSLPAVAPVLAHHFLEGHAPERALPHLLAAGRSALRLHATTEAIAFYEQALPIAASLPDANDTLLEVYTRRGRALELESRFAEAKRSYEELEQLGKERQDPALELEGIIAQGKLHATVTPFFDQERARLLMEKAMALAEATGNRAAEVRIRWNLVNIDRFNLTSRESAMASGERAIALARELNLQEELAYLLHDLSDVAGMSGDIDRGVELTTEAQGMWRQLGNEAMLADSLASESIWRNMVGNLPRALEVAEEALAISTRLGNPWGMAYARGVRGQALASMGEFGRALDDLGEAITQSRASGFVGGEVITSASRSRLLFTLGAFPEALELARECAATGRKQLPPFAPLGIGRLALSLIRQGDLAGAAHELADQETSGGYDRSYFSNELHLARIALAQAQGRTDDALRNTEEARELCRRAGLLLHLPELHLISATILMRRGQLDEAAGHLDRAGRRARKHGLRFILWRCLAASAELEEARGGHEAAALWAEAAGEIDFLAGGLNDE